MRPRAAALLNRLKARPDVITWDKSGEVSVAGETIPQSNISDLISDALRAGKNFNPTGSKEFFRVLSKINMPKRFSEESGKMESTGQHFRGRRGLIQQPTTQKPLKALSYPCKKT